MNFACVIWGPIRVRLCWFWLLLWLGTSRCTPGFYTILTPGLALSPFVERFSEGRQLDGELVDGVEGRGVGRGVEVGGRLVVQGGRRLVDGSRDGGYRGGHRGVALLGPKNGVSRPQGLVPMCGEVEGSDPCLDNGG